MLNAWYIIKERFIDSSTNKWQATLSGVATGVRGVRAAPGGTC